MLKRLTGLAALVTALSCGSDKEKLIPCQSDAECKGDRICVEGYCQGSEGGSVTGDDYTTPNGNEGICTRYFEKCSTPRIEEVIKGKSEGLTNCSPYMISGGLTRGCDNSPRENHNYLENGLSCEEDFHIYNRICDHSCTPETFLRACDTSCKKEQIDWYYGCVNSEDLYIDESHYPCSLFFCGVENRTCFDEPREYNDDIHYCLLEHGWMQQ